MFPRRLYMSSRGVSLQSKLTYRRGVRLAGQPDAVVSQLLLQQHPQLHPGNSHQLGLALLVLVRELGQLLTAAGGAGRGRRTLGLLVAGWPFGRRPRRLGADVVAAVVDGLLQREVHARGALLAQGLDRLQQARAMLLIEDADRVEIRIADLLADLKVVVAVVDERLRVLAEVERPQPLDHDVARHGHPGGLTLLARGPRLRPRSFASPPKTVSPLLPLLVALLGRFRFATIRSSIIRCARRRLLLLPSREAALQTTA